MICGWHQGSSVFESVIAETDLEAEVWQIGPRGFVSG
jgi:hypothetical protein